MTRLEIIELRAVPGEEEGVLRLLTRWQADMLAEGKVKQVKIYKNSSVATDYSIHLTYDPLHSVGRHWLHGSCLAGELEKFGLINHRVWLELQLSGHKADGEF